jgi:integrase
MANRNGWRLLTGRWTRSLGERGVRVRLFQMRKGGTFYRDVWVPGRGKDRRCLRTRHRGKADRLGRALLAALMTQDTESVVPETLTLSVLWRRYQHKCQAFLDNTARTRNDAAARAKVLLAYFGANRDVRALTADDQAAYAAARRAGGIVIGKDQATRPVRARSAEGDLALLHMMLNWAATVRVHGKRWLDGNPLAGVRREREENPRRPVATWDRFRATRRAMQKLARRAETDAERVRWIKLELALVLAGGTGRRLGSIRQLRWDDFDWTASTIRWRAEADKKRRESVVPLPPKLAAEVRQFRRRLGVLGGWVFVAELNPNVPMDRHLFDKWLAHARTHRASAQARRRTLAPVPAEVGDRAEAPLHHGRRRRQRLARHRDAPHVLRAAR